MGKARSYTPWTHHEKAELRARLLRGETFPQIARALGRSLHSVYGAADDAGLTRRQARELALSAQTITAPAHAAVAMPEAPHPVTLAPWEESADDFLARVLATTDREVAKAQGERFVTVRIESDRPVAISISSDWHVTTRGATDVRGLLAYADAIREAPGVYAVAVGDQLDNPIKHKPASPKDIPDDLRLLDLVTGRFGGKLLAMTSGNHDDWAKAFAGVDHLHRLATDHRIHYAPDELIVVVRIVAPGTDTVTAQYVIATRHAYRRRSTLNATHAPKRWLEEMANEWPHDPETGATFLPDIVAIGDDHMAAVETESTPRGEVVFCRMGAWQVSSGHARAKGFKRYTPTCPTIILHPTRRQTSGHSDYRKALDYLRRIRRGQ